MRAKLFTLTALLVGTVLAGCATLPPAKAIQDFKSVAGRWEGTVTGRAGTFPYALTIKEDGSWEAFMPGTPGRFVGIGRLRDGKIRAESYTTGRTYTYTLYEGEGERVLKGSSDEKDITSELRPAK